MRRRLRLALCLGLLAHATGATAASDRVGACGDAASGALRAVDAYMDTFNAGDAAAHAATLHYPSFRIDATGEVVVLASASEWEAQFRAARGRLPWHHSLYDSKRIVQLGPLKAHVAVHFTRYLASGEKVSEHDSLYVATCRAGRWAIVARSSFVPLMRPAP